MDRGHWNSLAAEHFPGQCPGKRRSPEPDGGKRNPDLSESLSRIRIHRYNSSWCEREPERIQSGVWKSGRQHGGEPSAQNAGGTLNLGTATLTVGRQSSNQFFSGQITGGAGSSISRSALGAQYSTTGMPRFPTPLRRQISHTGCSGHVCR